MKSQNSLNVPYLNSKFHFKMYTELAGGYKSKVLELWILSNFYFWRFFELLYKFGSNLDFKLDGNSVISMNSVHRSCYTVGNLRFASRHGRGCLWCRAGAVKAIA